MTELPAGKNDIFNREMEQWITISTTTKQNILRR